jgi:hypothetical protein
MRKAGGGEQNLHHRAMDGGKGQRDKSDRGHESPGERTVPASGQIPASACYGGLLKIAEPPATCWARQRAVPETSLNLRYVLCLEALRSLFDLELHKLAFVQ